ncbi:hypothetical protein PYCCODRAFT_1487261 [Trametes coccinea BRFM310]|uniref:CCHC-type domain-containing protein n=1 Tax=Trametes coccinea (strain BRFM310) TaxID=1353009 RepID=A0A1Y2ITH7_TRAC3|nr:hypothetical protein PYCCODRAFT_1487261 [Trametes coccinea BRFM310]
MASQPNAAEIIDLTEPEVIELNSDGEVLPDTKPSTSIATTPTGPGTEQDNKQTGSEQTKKKRKKRKRKPTSAAASEKEEGEIGTSSVEASRPQSRSSQNVDDIELHITTVQDDANAALAPVAEDTKKSLADRLSEPGSQNRRRGAETREEKRERREKEQEKDKKRKKDRDRGEDRERERHRDRDRDRERRRRSRSPREHEREEDRSRKRSRSRDRERRKRDKARESESSAPLFFEDVTPAELPATVKPPDSVGGPSKSAPEASTSANSSAGKSTDGLLLPAHVVIAEGGEDADASELKVPSLEGSDDEDYIDYLDYDDDRRVAAAEAPKPSRFVCKNCGAEGDHKTYECPVLICLTCGARDEHSTRSCPISKTCFTCGMKGHINKVHRLLSPTYTHCDRCGARTHQTNECPTLWRIYEYVDDDERQEILREREAKRTLALGQGGEGYIATDEWCYNCGGCGHLGDDCNDRPRPFDAPREPSAFSLYNILSGPFSSEATRPSKRAPRDWETASAFADGFGFVAPMEVGKQGRKKERARLERRAREMEEAEQDEDDWFGAARSKGRSSGGGGGGGGGNGGGGGSGGKIRFDFSHSSLDRDRRDGRDRDGGGRDSKRQRVSYDDLPGPSRETDSIQIRGAAKKQDRSYGSNGRYDRDPPSRGPRYRGGYAR